MKSIKVRFLLGLVLVVLLAGAAGLLRLKVDKPAQAAATENGSSFLPLIFNRFIQNEYVVIGWNDLGMHCYDKDYAVLSILPPYNNLWAQVIRRGDPPQVITQGIQVEYSFPDNSESATKTNFWVYAEQLFGAPLAANVGLKGFGLSGEMELALSGDHFIAEGVPLTEFSDSAPTTPAPYQLAYLVVKDAVTHQILADTTIVAPVSSEMRCDTCHNEQDPTNYRRDILLIHDRENGTDLVAQADGGTPVLCANCHADPALGLPGEPQNPTLSQAIHKKHAEETQDCYACHPGNQTQCLRDVMSQTASLWCTDCHGDMLAVAQESRRPWRDEPRCETCHDPQYAENPATLYRLSTGHGGLYCESCHNSTHAILPSREANDNLQSVALQGHPGAISECTVCHLTTPVEPGPHAP
ncbi:MAG TPA: hypothetical protein DEH22_00795 [Chloroflexi bacterium]|nr:hypothetical protein [Chloroflexota bacterium]